MTWLGLQFATVIWSSKLFSTYIGDAKNEPPMQIRGSNLVNLRYTQMLAQRVVGDDPKKYLGIKK